MNQFRKELWTKINEWKGWDANNFLPICSSKCQNHKNSSEQVSPPNNARHLKPHGMINMITSSLCTLTASDSVGCVANIAAAGKDVTAESDRWPLHVRYSRQTVQQWSVRLVRWNRGGDRPYKRVDSLETNEKNVKYAWQMFSDVFGKTITLDILISSK